MIYYKLKLKISNQIYTYDYRNRLSKTVYEEEDEIKKIIRYTYSNNDAIEENEYRYDDGKEKLKNAREYARRKYSWGAYT